jgi:hypothetical protein
VQAHVYWSPEIDTSVVLLTTAPSVSPSDSNFSAFLNDTDEHADDQGDHSRHDLGDGHHLHILRLTGIEVDQPLAAIIPLDLDGFDRVEALMRLLKALHGRAVPPDTRLTPQQLRRARQMLQAVDGHMNGATHRDIAAAIYGAEDIADEVWKSSSRRYATIDLIRDGLAMIAGGYRKLLHHRRRS